MKILLIEDDQESAAYIQAGLQEAGYEILLAADGDAGMDLVVQQTFDLMIVDRMLPNLDGLSLVRALRSGGVSTPVLFLSALEGVDDRVLGLDAGGDDYLTKPFALSELKARVAALMRRSQLSVAETILKVGELEMNLVSRTVRRGGVEIDLQPREWKILEYLLRHAGRIVTRRMLLQDVWDFHFDPQTNVVETHISRLRQKVDKGFATPLIHTVRNEGYSLRAPA